MKQRSVIGVLLYPFITLGIYSLYWFVSTKNEMNKRGDNIPTAWILIIPVVNIWWVWRYSQGVERVTDNKVHAILAFLLLYFLGTIGEAIIQDYFNKVEIASTRAISSSAQLKPPVNQQTQTSEVNPDQKSA